VLAPVVQILIDMRNEAKANKDYARSDAIRKQLADAGVELKDGKEGTTFNIVK
jgi:cysteinyl-tRNA synthetase